MCLTISSQHPWIYRAGYDILVYKRLIEGIYDWVSPYRGMPYILDTTHEVSKLRPRRGNVYEGLHAYIAATTPTNYGQRVFRAIIPKGALFIVGGAGDVVSTQLRVLSKPPEVVGKARFAAHKQVRRLTPPESLSWCC